MSHLDDQFLQSGAVHIVRVVVDDLPPLCLAEAAHDHHNRGGGGRDHLPPPHGVLVLLLQTGHYYTLLYQLNCYPQVRKQFSCPEGAYKYSDKGSLATHQINALRSNISVSKM